MSELSGSENARRRRRAIPLPLLVAACVAALVVLGLRFSRQSAALPATAPTGADSALTPKQVADLLAHVRELESASARARSNPAPALAEDPALRVRRELDELNAALQGQPKDPAFTQAFSTQIEQAKQLKELKPLRIDGIACGATLCRVDAAFSAGVDPEFVALRLIHRLKNTSSTWYSYHELLGPNRLVFFTARAGSSLPI